MNIEHYLATPNKVLTLIQRNLGWVPWELFLLGEYGLSPFGLSVRVIFGIYKDPEEKLSLDRHKHNLCTMNSSRGL